MKEYEISIGGATLPFTVKVRDVNPTTPVDPVDPIDPPDPVEPPTTQAGFRRGTNAFHWMPLDKLKMFSSIRLYVATGWIWREGGLHTEPLWQAETKMGYGLDSYLQDAKAAGKDVLLCTNQTPDWFNGYSDGWSGSNNFPPIRNLARDNSKDRAAASSYQEYADYYFQLVARYGSVTHSDSVLRVDTTPKYTNQPPTQKKSGLNLITRIEIGNEHDRWWDENGANAAAYMKPEEHAAMLWACYAACKKADPKIQVVMAGITGLDLKYLKAMKAYFDKHGLKFQSDVINVHHYSNVGNKYGVHPPTWEFSGSCMPEEDKNFGMINEIVSFGKSLTPALDTIVTECGCDSRPPSWMHIKGEKYGMSDEAAQGVLLAKTFAAYEKAGVKEVDFFMIADEEGSGLWQSCGVYGPQSKGYPKKTSHAAVEKQSSPAALLPLFTPGSPGFDLGKRFTIPDVQP